MIKVNEAAKLGAKRLKLMVFDIDGVMSEGSLIYSDKGVELKAFFAPDGIGLRMLQKAGITLAIITGRKSRCVALRAQDLGIEHVYQGIANKLDSFEHLLSKLNINADAAGFMGDDIIDVEVMSLCAFAAAPADCQERVKNYAQFISRHNGGRGAVREVCEFILDAQGKLDRALADYLPKPKQVQV